MTREFGAEEDSAYLPQGVTRVGYDADTEQYTYRDTAGQHYLGPQGSRYGHLQRVGRPSNVADIPLSRKDTDADTKAAWSYLLPFILLCFVIEIWIIWPSSSSPIQAKVCRKGSERHEVRNGDTCWAIANKYHTTVQDIELENEWTNDQCNALHVGEVVCVPTGRADSSLYQ